MLRALKFFSVCLLLSFAGCKVSQPGSVESKVVTEMKQKITVGGKGVPNPLPATEENIKEGQEHFGHHCQVCHSFDGQNSGVPFADHMAPPVPLLNSKDVQDYQDGQLKWIIENGINPSGMPAWKDILDDEEMWKVVHYIRHLPAKGSLGVPAVYQQEAAEHEHMHEKEGGKSGATPAEKAPHKHDHPH